METHYTLNQTKYQYKSVFFQKWVHFVKYESDIELGSVN